ncbi:MAG: hypothetical protein U0350_19320 [Caldilineaceae bacterium]
MATSATVIATVEPNHTVKVPSTIPVGEQVIVVPLPAIESLIHDAARRARFAATRAAVQQALATRPSQTPLSNQEIVALVKRARKAMPTNNLSSAG